MPTEFTCSECGCYLDLPVEFCIPCRDEVEGLPPASPVLSYSVYPRRQA